MFTLKKIKYSFFISSFFMDTMTSTKVISRGWIVTHVNNGFYLTYDLLVAGGFDIDECHYTSDSAVVYTYIHLRSPVVQSALTCFLGNMEKEKKLVLFSIFGYESVSQVRVEMPPSDHVGLKILYEHYVSKSSSFVSCTNGVAGVTRGYFWKSDVMSRLKTTLKGRNKRFIPFLQEMEKEVSESLGKDATIDVLRDELQVLKEQVESLQRYEYVCHVLRWRMRDVAPEFRNALLAPDFRKRPLMPDFFDFSPEAQREWHTSHSRRV